MLETPPPVEDLNKALNEHDLQAARNMIAMGNYAGALRDHLRLVLERDSENVAALDMKRQAEEANVPLGRRSRSRCQYRKRLSKSKRRGLPARPAKDIGNTRLASGECRST
jgi:hypothetical protein